MELSTIQISIPSINSWAMVVHGDLNTGTVSAVIVYKSGWTEKLTFSGTVENKYKLIETLKAAIIGRKRPEQQKNYDL